MFRCSLCQGKRLNIVEAIALAVALKDEGETLIDEALAHMFEVHPELGADIVEAGGPAVVIEEGWRELERDLEGND